MRKRKEKRKNEDKVKIDYEPIAFILGIYWILLVMSFITIQIMAILMGIAY